MRRRMAECTRFSVSSHELLGACAWVQYRYSVNVDAYTETCTLQALVDAMVEAA